MPERRHRDKHDNKDLNRLLLLSLSMQYVLENNLWPPRIVAEESRFTLVAHLADG